MDNLANCSRVSFTVVKREDIDGPHITTFYESAIAFGQASVVGVRRRKEGFLLISLWHIFAQFWPQLTVNAHASSIEKAADLNVFVDFSGFSHS